MDFARNRAARPGRGASVDELLDRAVAAINRGDRAAATALAGQVLSVDRGNVDAEDLLTAPGSDGEMRRLTWLLRLRALLARARGDEAGYRDYRDRYRAMAKSLGFEGHIALAEAMT
jgi:hypothetical protein